MTTINNNDTLKAIALEWDGVGTPRVVAQGEGQLATEIIAAAHAHGIPVRDEPQLALLLAQLQLDEQIPETLFVAVAEAIAFAYYLSGRNSITEMTEL